MHTLFRNRHQAGAKLADALGSYYGQPDTLVLGLPRGGIPVAWPVAHALALPLDIFLVRKLGVPGNPELAMGAVAEHDVCMFDETIIRHFGIDAQSQQAVKNTEQQELKRRIDHYRSGYPQPELTDRTLIVIDDGAATGTTLQTAVKALKELRPRALVVALPVASTDSLNKLRPLVQHLVCLESPEPFYGVGAWYQEFAQTSDEEVISLLADARKTFQSRSG